MVYFSLNFCFVCLIVKSIVIAASYLNKVFGSCVLLQKLELYFLGYFYAPHLAQELNIVAMHSSKKFTPVIGILWQEIVCPTSDPKIINKNKKESF